MKRILEPELMEDESQAQAYAEADFEDANSRFMALFEETFGQQAISGYVLDLGCGPADITLRFARAYPNCVVHGLDGSEAMLRYGRESLAEAPALQGRVALFQGLAPGAELPRREYDVIISNSLLHHLHHPQAFWKTVQRYAVSGGRIFIMDLKRPKTATEARAVVETYSADEPEVLKRDFYNSLLAAFEVGEIEAQLKEAGLDQLSAKVVSDRHVVIAGYMT